MPHMHYADNLKQLYSRQLMRGAVAMAKGRWRWLAGWYAVDNRGTPMHDMRDTSSVSHTVMNVGDTSSLIAGDTVCRYAVLHQVLERAPTDLLNQPDAGGLRVYCVNVSFVLLIIVRAPSSRYIN